MPSNRLHFLTDFFPYFVWRCIIVKSTLLFFLVMLPPVFRLLKGQRSYFGGHSYVRSNRPHFLTVFFPYFVQMCIIVKSTHL